MPTLLVTGSSGLVGSACVRHFAGHGWTVHGLDSNARRGYFGPDGDTRPTRDRLLDVRGYYHHDVDLRDEWAAERCVRGTRPDLLIHAAAQPSHDYAADHPLQDFEVNALATLRLLEAVRRHSANTVFCFLSTNKVYGDAINQLPMKELPTRYDYDWELREILDNRGEPVGYVDDGANADEGINEQFDIDASTHSLFGCSKLAADLYVQEYGRNLGLGTVSFRCGCLTGGSHAGAEQHGFLSYLAKCVKEGRPYKVYGYKGKQVRDQLHAVDVARACHEFYKHPRGGEVYNLGGGRDNAVSVLEAIRLLEDATGKRLAWEYVDKPRKGDHVVWISDCCKFRAHYPAWGVSRTLADIVKELCQ